MAQLLVSRDSCVGFVAGRLLQHEDSISERAFLRASVVKSIMVKNPGASKKKLKELSNMLQQSLINQTDFRNSSPSRSKVNASGLEWIRLTSTLLQLAPLQTS